MSPNNLRLCPKPPYWTHAMIWLGFCTACAIWRSCVKSCLFSCSHFSSRWPPGAPKVISLLPWGDCSHPFYRMLLSQETASHSCFWNKQDLSCLSSVPPSVRHQILLKGCQKIVICWQCVALNPPTVVAARCLFLILIHIEAILDLEPKRHDYFFPG